MKEDRERRRALALSKKADEDRKRDEEERKLRREREEVLAAQMAASKPKAIVRAKAKVCFFRNPSLRGYAEQTLSVK